MNVKIDEKALKDLMKIEKKFRNQILNEIKKLENFPNCLNIKKLKNFYPRFRLRVGKYRIIFDVEKDNVVVYK